MVTVSDATRPLTLPMRYSRWKGTSVNAREDDALYFGTPRQSSTVQSDDTTHYTVTSR